MKAERYITHPSRVLINGSPGSGKTHLAKHILKTVFVPINARIIVLCPTYYIQDSYRELDSIVNKKDVITTVEDDTFQQLLDALTSIKEKAVQQGVAPRNIVVLVDDVAGSSVLHGSRFTAFNRFNVQMRHINTSCIVITQSFTFISNSFREFATALIVFPVKRVRDKEIIFQEFNPMGLSKSTIFKMITKAWRGGFSDDDQVGDHFLFIYLPERKAARYFIDFDSEMILPSRVCV